MASQETVERAGPGFTWRELNSIQVKGRAQPSQHLRAAGGKVGEETPQQKLHAAAYAEGLGFLAQARLPGCGEVLCDLVALDRPAVGPVPQARGGICEQSAGPDWQPVNALEGK